METCHHSCRGCKVHSYRRAFFPKFPKFGNSRSGASIYGGVLSLFVKFSRTKNIELVNIPIFGKKSRKIWKIEKLREKNVENLEKKLFDKNDPETSWSTFRLRMMLRILEEQKIEPCLIGPVSVPTAWNPPNKEPRMCIKQLYRRSDTG